MPTTFKQKVEEGMHSVLAILCFVFIFSAMPKKAGTTDLGKDVVAPHVVPAHILHEGSYRTFGTGFNVKYKGKVFIVTNAHVCEFGLEMVNDDRIRFQGRYERVIDIDTEHDLCLLTSSETEGLEIAKEDAKIMDKVITVGFPNGHSKAIREGRVYGFSRESIGGEEERPVIITDFIVDGGASGSPVVNEAGEVIGVVFAKRLDVLESWVVPRTSLISFLDKHTKE